MNSINTANTVHSKWRTKTTIALLAVLLATFILAYFPVWRNLILAWSTSDDYSHGFLILPLCAYILWRKKEILKKTPIRPSKLGLVFFILSSLLYLFAYFSEIVTLASFSLILVLAGTILYLFGLPILKEVSFPLFLLLFMIPVPSQVYAKLTIPLQLFVSKTTVLVASYVDLPIYREGNVIHVPNRTLEVVRACSGLRSMVSLLMLGAVFGYLTLKSNILRAVLFCSGIPTAIVVNIIRLLLLVLALQYYNYDLTKGSIHTLFGVAIFVLALALIAATKEVLSIWDKRAIKE